MMTVFFRILRVELKHNHPSCTLKKTDNTQQRKNMKSQQLLDMSYFGKKRDQGLCNDDNENNDDNDDNDDHDDHDDTDDTWY